jgi:hypothetical protein
VINLQFQTVSDKRKQKQNLNTILIKEMID